MASLTPAPAPPTAIDYVLNRAGCPADLECGVNLNRAFCNSDTPPEPANPFLSGGACTLALDRAGSGYFFCAFKSGDCRDGRDCNLRLTFTCPDVPGTLSLSASSFPTDTTDCGITDLVYVDRADEGASTTTVVSDELEVVDRCFACIPGRSYIVRENNGILKKDSLAATFDSNSVAC
jgi:hypothetical protein